MSNVIELLNRISAKNKLYLITGVICFFGFVWLYFDYHSPIDATLCPIKQVTGYPCPSCGTTRSVKSLLQGDINQALLINPLGLVAVLIAVGIILLMSIDLIFRKDYFFRTYRWIEQFLQTQRILSAILILLILLNWIWNISKGL
ncbi:DUF2752 domain-containing protein [Sphingobacterium sp. DK4209]|uniref:DUF2752 domain-containing protein n=1 Tax=Sphingobacterium zhuxiongii TaxID=2662364 RepID=A0A5Q0Q7J6_9SPHI|nr:MULTISPECIES: DUF2752 domain-containing protein [unclassified Sphingobacterium]MVZ66297.1 DUF2752 domain-containing protein [Sphingobacterium sp. DK4209]QGA25079.1 DUF2752 domain-containing protein [Sphingobacterium sp. dk4302]